MALPALTGAQAQDWASSSSLTPRNEMLLMIPSGPAKKKKKKIDEIINSWSRTQRHTERQQHAKRLPPPLTGSSWPRTNASSKRSPTGSLSGETLQCSQRSSCWPGKQPSKRFPPPAPARGPSRPTSVVPVPPPPYPMRSCSISSIFSARAMTRLMISFSSSVNSSLLRCRSGWPPRAAQPAGSLRGEGSQGFVHRSCVCMHMCNRTHVWAIARHQFPSPGKKGYDTSPSSKLSSSRKPANGPHPPGGNSYFHFGEVSYRNTRFIWRKPLSSSKVFSLFPC